MWPERLIASVASTVAVHSDENSDSLSSGGRRLDLEEPLMGADFSSRAPGKLGTRKLRQASLQFPFYSAPNLELSHGHGQS